MFCREQLAFLCNRRGVLDAVEVGVDCGDFAYWFLSNWKGYTLHLVDPYLPYWEMPWDRSADRQIAINRLSVFGGRARFILHDSATAATLIPLSRAIQFVYIDADHSYDAAKKDIEIWWCRLASGGILAGHDYDHSHPGVIRAVTEFAASENLQVFITCEESVPASWFVFKP